MSGKNNVNPGQYKVAGRERQGEDVVHDRQKQVMGQERARVASVKKKPRAGSTKPGAADDSEGQAR